MPVSVEFVNGGGTNHVTLAPDSDSRTPVEFLQRRRGSVLSFILRSPMHFPSVIA